MISDRKEYHSIILAALLHDIGKLLHRGSEKYNGRHEEASEEFIKEFRDKLQNERFYDLDLVRILVKHHHSTKNETLRDASLEIKTEDEKDRVWRLLRLVKDADSYSCAERDLDQQWKSDGDKRKAPLDSIFSLVNLDLKEPFEGGKWGYQLNPLSPTTGFPDKIGLLPEDEINHLINRFEEKIPDFSKFISFDDILNSLLNLLERYTWAVPSDTRYSISDVSLYDHLRSSAAIAACLYKRHIAQIENGKNLDRQYEFILVGGDFSGIQDYIFDITNRGSGGAAKRLRSRSLFISLFSEVAIHKILHALELPLVCNLFSAGGKFLLIAPNIEGVPELLDNVKLQIEKEIRRTYFNQFCFLMSWHSIRGFRKEFKTYSFFQTADEMFHRLETEKLRKSRNVLIDAKNASWNVGEFIATEIYNSYGDAGDCKVCGKGPAILEDKGPEPDDITMCCPICYRDKYTIGQKLPTTNYIAFGVGPIKKNEEEGIVIFPSNGEEKNQNYYVNLLKDLKDKPDYYLIYNIGKNSEAAHSGHGKQPLIKKIANYVPIGNDHKILDFEELSLCSKWHKGNDSYGIPLLGVLKADVDNLGLAFSKGFENPQKAEKGLDDIDRKTISRFLTMSRMLELFFSGWIKEILSENHKQDMVKQLLTIEGIDEERFRDYLGSEQIDFKHIYTVYSGGDDLVLVGPWETMIVFAIYLNMQFRKFTCNNKSITLSAGLTFVKPKHPIASSIKQADELLNTSKEQGKNRITLFGTTVAWDRLPDLINFFLFLNNRLGDEHSGINRAFLYRLLEYHRMALRFIVENDVLGLKYLSAMSYDIGRNIITRDEKGRIINRQEELEGLQSLINDKASKDSLIYSLKIPLFFALYRNRKWREE